MESSNEYNSTGHIVNYNLQEELNHGVYVSRLAGALGEELGLDEQTCRELKIAGVLHDIGKLKLNRYIYSSDDTLMIEEMKYVRMHAKLSYEILKQEIENQEIENQEIENQEIENQEIAEPYSEFILQSILHHHENYDGSGYPDNISGEQIPFGARILRVCDVFAALTSDRPYRKSFDAPTAMELMIDEVKNFDLRIFLAFQRVVHENRGKPHVIELKELIMNQKGE